MERDKKRICSFKRSRLRLSRNYFTPTYIQVFTFFLQKSHFLPLSCRSLITACASSANKNRVSRFVAQTPRQNGRGVARVCERRCKKRGAPKKGIHKDAKKNGASNYNDNYNSSCYKITSIKLVQFRIISSLNRKNFKITCMFCLYIYISYIR